MKSRVFWWGLLIVGGGLLIGYGFSNPFFNFKQFLNSRVPVPEKSAMEEASLSESAIGAVIENLPEARPQFGLAAADLVMETITEGGITRYLAVYGKKGVLKIGPVRSARPYFVDWAWGLNIPLAHSGGSKEALEKISTASGFLDLDEFFSGQYFWRDKNKKAPHNLFTSTALLGKLTGSRNWMSQKPALGWKVQKDNTGSLDKNLVGSINIDFSFDAYAVSYRYDGELKVYKRFLAGKPHLDGTTGEQIAAQNIVVLYTLSSVIDQQLLTIDLETLGSGRAMVFRDGGMLQARWKKEAWDKPLELLDADGSQVVLDEGPTWMAVIDQNGTASWK